MEKEITPKQAVASQIANLLTSCFIDDNGVECFEGWCENGGVFYSTYPNREEKFYEECELLFGNVRNHVNQVVFFINQFNGVQTYNREEDQEWLKEKLHDELVGENNRLTEEEVQNLFDTKDYQYIIDSYDINEVRVCSECGGLMNSGYLVGDGAEYYCCDECLHKHYTEDEYQQMYDDDDAFYTEWY